ncbi:MAG: hypothetical protein IPP69_12400 [Flavobacteriales bacterium]|nr:hypothetical protein [Flavobacteriales bacterium]
MIRQVLLFGFVLLLASCKKEDDLSGIDLGYDYFPNKVGSYIIYDVDSTYYGVNTESYSFQIKEELIEEFVDNEGEPNVKINRFYRPANNTPWILIDVWTQKRTTTTAEKVVDNIRYVKMEFPVKNGGTWNGNAYNNYPAQQYKYSNLAGFADVGILQFDNTVTVEQQNNVNLVDEEIFYEVYAKGVGMVFRQATDLNTQGSQTSGYEVVYRAISYSIE